MRGRSNSNVGDMDLPHQFRVLSKAQQMELQTRFKKNEQGPGRGITFYDMANILNAAGFKMNERRKDKLNKDILSKQIKILDLNSLYWGASALKREREDTSYNNNPQNSEYLDAFIALGGNSDKTGFVNKDNMMRILKQQFGLMFQIQQLMEGLDFNSQDRLDFNQFCQLFQKEKVDHPNNNMMSILSARQGPVSGQFQFTQRQFLNYETNFQNQMQQN